MKILFDIFGLQISFLGFTTMLGILAAVVVARIEAKRKGLNVDKLFDLAFYAVLAGFIGARLFYILFYNLDFYLNNPSQIFSIHEGGMSIHGGLILAFIVSIIYIRKNELDFFQYADAAAPGLILAQAIGRVGCDVFGKEASQKVPWAIEYQGIFVHPVQIYEFTLNYFSFFFLWRMRKHLKYDGQLFFLYVIFFALNRGIVEFFRMNPSVFGWFSVSHLLSVIFIIGALVAMHYAKLRKSDYTIMIPNSQENNRDLLRDILMVLVLWVASILTFHLIQS